jgi:type I restriction enzyme S subunit
MLPIGALLLCSRATIGEVRIAGCPVCTNQGFKSLVCRPDTDNEFLYYKLLTMKPQMVERAIGSTFLEISKRETGSLEVATPPLPEQRAIAEALSDVDGLLVALDKLIAKKRDLKQAAMQQLLTGKTRLPSFSGAWKSHSFGDIAKPVKTRIAPNDGNKGQFCIELENIEGESGRLLGHSELASDASIKSVFSPDDILFGKLRAYLRKYWFADRNGVCSTEIWALRPQEGCSARYVFYLVSTNRFIQSASESYGTHMPRSDWKIVKELRFNIPTIAEQNAIAKVLSDMDAELEVLEQRREKTRLLKQGMMQELLTGRIRLL